MDREMKNIENYEHSFITWVKKYKKGILIAGGAIVAIGSGYVVYKNWSSIHALFKSFKPEPIANNNSQIYVEAAMPVVDVIPEIRAETVNRIINAGKAFGASGHNRNLPNGRNASAEKVALALERGIKLAENQTWVEDYLKNCTAA
jgi:hypothetical protein